MKIASSLVLLLCLSLVVAVANSQTVSDEAENILATMFNYANAHNVRALEELKERIDLRKDWDMAAAYSLALYIAAPEKYKQQYIDNFPVDEKGIMIDFYERIELKRLTPTFLYSIDAIGSIAEEGNDKAIGKVLMGSIHSDGIVGEQFCDILEKIFDKQPQKTVKALCRMDEEQRKKVYSCFEMMDAREFNSLKSKLKQMRPKATEPEIKIIREIENYR